MLDGRGFASEPRGGVYARFDTEQDACVHHDLVLKEAGRDASLWLCVWDNDTPLAKAFLGFNDKRHWCVLRLVVQRTHNSACAVIAALSSKRRCRRQIPTPRGCAPDRRARLARR